MTNTDSTPRPLSVDGLMHRARQVAPEVMGTDCRLRLNIQSCTTPARDDVPCTDCYEAP